MSKGRTTKIEKSISYHQKEVNQNLPRSTEVGEQSGVVSQPRLHGESTEATRKDTTVEVTLGGIFKRTSLT